MESKNYKFWIVRDYHKNGVIIETWYKGDYNKWVASGEVKKSTIEGGSNVDENL